MQTIGPYRVIRTIGVGGMGEVFLCALERAGGFEKRVAVKRARGEGAPLALFEREARLAALLDHRHIVQIFDFGQDDEGAWLAMEFVQGVDLKAVLDLGEPVPPGVALEVGVACARGLAFAHRATDTTGRPLGIVHRDVSPHNVLLSFQGDVKLGDFGVALATARAGDAFAVHGKLAYMSPEQASGGAADPRSDLYALGVVLYELLAGRRCFFDWGPVEALEARVRAGAPLCPLPEAAPGLPEALVAVVARALATDPAERFQDGDALADALLAAAAQAGLTVGAPALGPWLAAHFGRAHQSLGPAPVEATATAAAPIEATATAAVPARSGTPSVPAAPAPTPPPGSAAQAEVAAPTERRGGGWIALGAVGIGLAAWALWPGASAPPPPVDAGASVVDARPVDAGAPVARPDAAPTPDAKAGVDAAVDAAVGEEPDAEPHAELDAQPRRRPPRRLSPRRPARADQGVADARPPRDAAPATAAAPVTAAAPGTAAAPATAAPPPGPRMRLGAGIQAQGGPLDGQRWAGVPAAGLMLTAQAPGGPAVRVRVVARGGRFVATVASNPFGRLAVDGRDLGPTPVAGVPLHAGTRRLVVSTATGRTPLLLECAP